MDEDNLLPFSLPAVCRKKVSVAFDGGLLSSDGFANSTMTASAMRAQRSASLAADP
jgi:hypothetical protein